ncbi:MAG: GNAT family N-acetyltransferase [Pirellulales bacterium]
MRIQYCSDDRGLTSEEFVTLFSIIWPHILNRCLVQQALRRTINVTARDGTALVGCARVLTDGYLFGTITEILLHPRYSHLNLGKHLIELAEQASPTSLCFGSQTVSADLMAEMGWTCGPVTFFKRKPLPDGP